MSAWKACVIERALRNGNTVVIASKRGCIEVRQRWWFRCEVKFLPPRTQGRAANIVITDDYDDRICQLQTIDD